MYLLRLFLLQLCHEEAKAMSPGKFFLSLLFYFPASLDHILIKLSGLSSPQNRENQHKEKEKAVTGLVSFSPFSFSNKFRCFRRHLFPHDSDIHAHIKQQQQPSRVILVFFST